MECLLHMGDMYAHGLHEVCTCLCRKKRLSETHGAGAPTTVVVVVVMVVVVEVLPENEAHVRVCMHAHDMHMVVATPTHT